MTGTLVACDGIGCPVLEEALYFLLTVALTFFQETRILYVKHPTLSIHDDEDRKSEAATVMEPLHQKFCLLLLRLAFRLARIVVHVDIHEVGVDELADA